MPVHIWEVFVRWQETVERSQESGRVLEEKEKNFREKWKNLQEKWRQREQTSAESLFTNIRIQKQYPFNSYSSNHLIFATGPQFRLSKLWLDIYEPLRQLLSKHTKMHRYKYTNTNEPLGQLLSNKKLKIISVSFKPLQPFNVEEVKIKKGDIWSNSNGVCACLRGRW